MVETQIDTSYGDGGAGDLVQYLDKERGLRNRRGEEMTREEREAFVEKSREHEFRRLVTISPGDGDRLSDREMNRRTRQTVSGFLEDRPSADYCFAIHRDTEHHHAQVALTGKKRDLYMDRDDIERVREQAREQFPDLDREEERTREQQRERDLERTLGREVEREREQQREREQERSRERSRGYGWY
jgi:hypothetical protein